MVKNETRRSSNDPDVSHKNDHEKDCLLSKGMVKNETRRSSNDPDVSHKNDHEKDCLLSKGMVKNETRRSSNDPDVSHKNDHEKDCLLSKGMDKNETRRSSNDPDVSHKNDHEKDFLLSKGMDKNETRRSSNDPDVSHENDHEEDCLLSKGMDKNETRRSSNDPDVSHENDHEEDCLLSKGLESPETLPLHIKLNEELNLTETPSNKKKMLDRGRLTIFCVFLQAVFIILFAVFVRYDPGALPPVHYTKNSTQRDDDAHAAVSKYYPFFQDVHVMIFVGFGFLMTFLRRYGFSAVGLNMLIAALSIQWAILTGGWILHLHDGKIELNMEALITAEFAAATVLISFGAVLGKLNALQLLVMALMEIVVFQANEYIVFKICKATDIGDSMVVHAFGAYFGIAVARVIFTDDVHRAEAKEESVYHSDLFAMIGTVFLWIFWPSFNSCTAVGEGHYRAVINTYLSLASCAVTAFAISALVNKDKFNMNATLAGGVAVGTMADLMIQPWGALFIGFLAAVLSTVGYRFVTPFLSHKLRFHDTCGVNNLHGMPGVFSGLGGIVCAALATHEVYKSTLGDQFGDVLDGVRTPLIQAAYQAAGLASSVLIAIISGLITGLLLKIPIWKQPKGPQIFDDTNYWTVPEEGFPTDPSVESNHGGHALEGKAAHHAA